MSYSQRDELYEGGFGSATSNLLRAVGEST